ncbi:MAG: PhoU domain-containing protein, partial [Candidatus Natronoplasma sp.]
AVRIAENLVDLEGFDKALQDEIIEQSELSLSILERSAEAFFEEDLEGFNEAIDLRDELVDKNDQLMSQVKQEKKEKVTPLSYILESISRTGSYATDISEIGINYMMSK